MYRGEGNDLDLIVFPNNINNLTKERMIEEVSERLKIVGLKKRFNYEQVQKSWKKEKNSDDSKTVEIWNYNNHKVDIFYLM